MNNPRRPNEASGTSGQKAGLNGIPNFSVLDGWWCEGYNGENGWVIGQDGDYPDEAAQDAADALSLYDTLEHEIVPLFYDRGPDGLPHGWLAKMRASMKSVAPVFSLTRMLKEYCIKYYFPAARYSQRMRVASVAHDLAQWEQRVRLNWPEVAITAQVTLASDRDAASPAVVRAVVRPAALAPEMLAVELVYGPERSGELTESQIVPLRLTASQAGEYVYEGEFGPIDRGAVTYGVRVRPHHPELPIPFIVPLVKWA